MPRFVTCDYLLSPPNVRNEARSARMGTSWRRAAAVVAAGLVLAGCGQAAKSSGGDDKIAKLEVMAPADPGGGWDQTARSISTAVSGARLAGSVQVSNVG